MKEKRINNIREILCSFNDDKIIHTLESINLEDAQELIMVLLDIFESTSNYIIKNRLSIILHDLKDPRALPIIIKEIKKKENNKRRGKLIYACEAFDCINYFDFFIKLLFDLNYEVSMTSVMVLKKMTISFDNEKLDSIIKDLIKRRREVDDPTKGNINDVIKHLKKIKKIKQSPPTASPGEES